MLAAFLTATFAELLKENIQKKLKLKNLRIALYREIISNCVLIFNTHYSGKDDEMIYFEMLSRYGLRTECYNSVLQSEPMLFYQIEEAKVFNLFQNTALSMMEVLRWISVFRVENRSK
jgi:hypothetical protein